MSPEPTKEAERPERYDTMEDRYQMCSSKETLRKDRET
jgi:hypothetical protein